MDVLRVREVLQPAGERERLQDCQLLILQRHSARMIHFAHHVRDRRFRFDHDDGDHGVRHVVLQLSRDDVAKLDGRPPVRLEIADQRERDLPVGPDLHGLRQLRVAVDLDAELVAQAEVVVGATGSVAPLSGPAASVGEAVASAATTANVSFRSVSLMA